MTNLPNHIYFNLELEKQIKNSLLNKSELAVILMDLDYFKNINDTFGHTIGDKLLKIFSKRISQHLHSGDTIARLGGDEFALILPSLANKEKVNIYKSKFKQAVNKEFIVDDKEFFIGTTMGICFLEDECTPEELLRRADIALHEAKNLGRGSICVFSEHLNQIARTKHTIENDLRRAIDKNELFLEFQPQHCLETNRLIGIETLLRWKHSEHGLISPAFFIPFAEKSNLIVNISECVISESMKCYSIIREQIGSDFLMSINLSAKELRYQGVIEQLIRCCSDNNIDHQFIELELTENSIMHDEASIVTQTLRKRGFSIAIDDFGTGYSSFGRLINFPVDRLKIDKSFVEYLPEQGQNATIVEAAIKLGKAFNAKVIAEGVENMAQVEFLKSQHCDQAQGYYYSKPLPMYDLINYMIGQSSTCQYINQDDSVVIFKPFFSNNLNRQR